MAVGSSHTSALTAPISIGCRVTRRQERAVHPAQTNGNVAVTPLSIPSLPFCAIQGAEPNGWSRAKADLPEAKQERRAAAAASK